MGTEEKEMNPYGPPQNNISSSEWQWVILQVWILIALSVAYVVVEVLRIVEMFI